MTREDVILEFYNEGVSDGTQTTFEWDTILKMLDKWGEIKWNEAQDAANKFRQSQKLDGKYPAAVKTPYVQ